MGASTIDGPEFVYGNLGNIPGGTLSSATIQGQGAVHDPNLDAGPSMFFQGSGLLDPRVLFLKDKIQGWTGMAPGWLAMDIIESARTIPSTAAVNNIVVAQNITSLTAMTLVAANPFTSTSATGFAVNVPYRAFSAVTNGGAITTAAICLDYGFGYATAAAGSTTLTVGNIWDYFVGMPLCIAGAGNVGGTSCLMTFVTAIVSLTSATLTINNASAFTGTVAIGTGDLWGPNEASPATGGYPTPLAHSPYLANGPALLLDARQTLCRGLRIVSVTGNGASASGILITGADLYGMPMTQLVTVPNSGAFTGWTTKNFKYINSIVAQFADAHNYSVGTADQFGFAMRSTIFEDMAIFFGSTWNGGPNTGYVAAVLTTPATNITGDVRGSVLCGTSSNTNSAAVTPFGTTVISSGSLSGITLTGNRLEIAQQISVSQAIQAEQSSPYYLTGVTQV